MYRSRHENDCEMQEFHYRSGQIMRRRFHLGYRSEGEDKWWYLNGQLKERRFYRNGQENGEQREWYENGRIMVCAFNQDGMYEGEGKSWYVGGRIWEHKFFRKGVCVDANFTIKKKICLIKIKKKLWSRTFSIHASLSSFLINDLFSLVHS